MCLGTLLAKDAALKPLATDLGAQVLAAGLRASAAGKVAEAAADVTSLLD